MAHMPGGRPRKYADKAAAKAADRLRAIERKAAKKVAREGHGDGVEMVAIGLSWKTSYVLQVSIFYGCAEGKLCLTA